MRQHDLTNMFKRVAVPCKPKVLLIDDDRTMRRLARASIGQDCQLLMAANANMGANLFKTENPDICFIDISLPDNNGHNLLEWMLEIEPSTYGVMLSGFHDNNNVLRSASNGAKGFISKPFDAEKMKLFIRRSLAS